MSEHEQYEELSILAAIGAATEEETAQLESHLAGCSPCRDAHREYLQAAAMLPYGLEPVQPPAEVKLAIFETIEATKVRPFEKPKRMNPVWWLATAATFFIAMFLWSELRLRALRERVNELVTARQHLDSEKNLINSRAEKLQAQLDAMAAASTRSIQLSGQEAQPSASARVFLDAPNRRAFVFFHGLPQNSGDQSYQLWIIRSDQPAPIGVGVFDVSPSGEGRISLENLPVDTDIKAFAVTLEPRGGVPAPTTPLVLLGGTS